MQSPIQKYIWTGRRLIARAGNQKMMPLHAEALKKRFGLRGNGGLGLTADEYYSPEELLLENVIYLSVMLNVLLDPVRCDDQLAFLNIDDCGECCASMVR